METTTTAATVTIVNAPRSLRRVFPTRTVRTCLSNTCSCFSHDGSYEETSVPAAVAGRLVRLPGDPHSHARHIWRSTMTAPRHSRGEWAANQVQSFVENTPFLSERERGECISAFVKDLDEENWTTQALSAGYELSRNRAEKAQQRAEKAKRKFSESFCDPLKAALAKAGF